MIPPFRSNGSLPPGVHWTTWETFVERFGTTERRQRLLQGLRSALEMLKAAGCRTVYVDGSFVTAKPLPGDFDVCWEGTGVDEDLLPPVFFNFADGRAAQKGRFLGEFFPAQWPERASGKTFLDFFQTEKATGKPKGIIALDLGDLP